MKDNDNTANTNFEYAEMLACDMANEISYLGKNNISSSRYDHSVIELYKQSADPIFYLSDQIDRYVQTDKTKAERQEKYYSYLLYLDEYPLCIINTDTSDEENQKWDYTVYPVEDERCASIIATGRFYMLNGDDYGLYLVGDDDYYTLAHPLSENKEFMSDVRKLGITTKNINRQVLDLGLIDKNSIQVNIRKYENDLFDESALSIIADYLKENEEDLAGGKLIGPIFRYQYYFSSLNSIEACDYNVENETFSFRLLKDGKIKAELYYDSFEESVDVRPVEETDDTDTYFVNLSEVGNVYVDKVLCEDPQAISYSKIDKMVTEKIQNMIRNDKPSFKVYDLN